MLLVIHMVHDSRITLMTQHQTLTTIDKSMADAVASLETMYRDEITTARDEARKHYEEAILNKSFAEHYAQATVLVGEQAMIEIERQYYNIVELQLQNTHIEKVALSYKNTAEQVYTEGRSHIAQSSQFLQTAYEQLAQLKTELTASATRQQSQDASIVALRDLQSKIPEAERVFKEMSDPLEQAQQTAIRSDESKRAEMKQLTQHLLQAKQLIETSSTREARDEAEIRKYRTENKSLKDLLSVSVDRVDKMTRENIILENNQIVPRVLPTVALNNDGDHKVAETDPGYPRKRITETLTIQASQMAEK